MKNPGESFEKLYEIMKKLRSPEGCPWDREQTPKSVRSNLVEESYEAVEAINADDTNHIKEEIGDVYLVSTFMAYMYEQEGRFSVSDAIDEVCAKLVRRHPHVFSEQSEADTPEKVIAQWKDIKVSVEGKSRRTRLSTRSPMLSLPWTERIRSRKKPRKPVLTGRQSRTFGLRSGKKPMKPRRLSAPRTPTSSKTSWAICFFPLSMLPVS